MLLALAIVISMPVFANAAATASDYFSYTRVEAYSQGGGWILIEIDAEATDTMQRLGASEVYIFEQQSDGHYDCIYTFHWGDYPYMMEANTHCAYIDVEYKGTVGVRYYAMAGCYAKNANGNETLYSISNTVVA